MSYAGPARTRSTASADANPPKASAARSSRRPPAPLPPVTESTDWGQVLVFSAGLALGISVGAGIALLTAPQSGLQTRVGLARKSKRAGRAISRRGHDAWDDFREELRDAGRALRERKERRALRKELEASEGLDG